MSFIKQIIKESLLLEKESVYSYGCAMLDFTFPEMKSIHKKIEKEDIYNEEGNDKYGLEKESHITLLYGFHKTVTKEDVEEILNEFTFSDKITIDKVSLFEQDDYDVLKFNCSSPLLKKINKALSKLPNTNKYPEYKAHLTIGYLQPGKGKKYVDMFKDKEYELVPKEVTLSFADKAKGKTKIKIQKSLTEKILNEISIF